MPEWPKPVEHVFHRLLEAGYEAFAVGGYVRDTLLGRSVHDYDVATNATPSMVSELFPRTVATGLQHGTVTVIVDGYPVEVTTYRIDSTYSDGRHPDAVHFTESIEEDLSRRDFTINAMAMSLDGGLIDPYGGLLDLEMRCIRAVGRHPHHRFHEDGLRILRSFRFAAQLGFDIHPGTLRAMQSEARMIERVSPERIGIEFDKLSQGTWWRIAPVLATGPWWNWFPDPLHSLQIGLERFVEGKIETRWRRALRAGTRLLAECQHEASATVESVAKVRLIGTMACWASLAHFDVATCRKLCRTFGWSNERSRLLADVISILNDGSNDTESKFWRQHLYDYGFLANLTASIVKDALYEAPVPATGGAKSLRLKYLRTFHCHAYDQPLWSSRDLKVDGHDMMALGLAGPKIGHMLIRLTSAVLSGEVANERQPLLDLAKRYLQAEG